MLSQGFLKNVRKLENVRLIGAFSHKGLLKCRYYLSQDISTDTHQWVSQQIRFATKFRHLWYLFNLQKYLIDFVFVNWKKVNITKQSNPYYDSLSNTFFSSK